MKLSHRTAAPSSTAMCGIVAITCSCSVAAQAQQLDDVGDQMPPAAFDAYETRENIGTADGGAEAFSKLEGKDQQWTGPQQQQQQRREELERIDRSSSSSSCNHPIYIASFENVTKITLVFMTLAMLLGHPVEFLGASVHTNIAYAAG